MEVYAGMVENMDYHFGRVVTFLRDIGEFENTVILFCSDNGANPWVTVDYPGNRGSKWLEQFDDSIGNLGNPGSAYAYGMGWASACAGPTATIQDDRLGRRHSKSTSDRGPGSQGRAHVQCLLLCHRHHAHLA